ncbi:MAG: aspartate aminotransferase family protein [Thermodesulfobacteriota bacterium]
MTTELQSLQDQEAQLLCTTYNRYPIAVESARGSRLYTPEGKSYVDLLAGISVCNLGHCPPELTEVMQHQAERLVHISNLFYQRAQLELAEKLLATCSLDRVFFANSGAEANEAAIKLARRYMQIVCSREAYEVITLHGSFHGRTLATLTATGQEGIKKGFAPLPQGFLSIPPNDLEALEKAISHTTAGVLLEIVQGEGGVQPLSTDYLQGVQAICRRHGVLFMVDEVQTGMGRTGRMWGYQHAELTPDVITCAKALANGLPMGAMLCTKETARAFDAGAHATTFGGGALVAAVAAKVVDILEQKRLVERSAEEGARLKNALHELQAAYPQHIREVRGLGLMLGIELFAEGKTIWEALLDRGYVCNLTQGTTLRLLPPLTTDRADLDGFVQTLENILAAQPQTEAY